MDNYKQMIKEDLEFQAKAAPNSYLKIRFRICCNSDKPRLNEGATIVHISDAWDFINATESTFGMYLRDYFPVAQ